MGESARHGVASSKAPKYCSNEAEARHLSERSTLSTRGENNAASAIFQQYFICCGVA
jgi:hypothetical protein